MARYYQKKDGPDYTEFGVVSEKPYREGRPDMHALASVSYQTPREQSNFHEYNGRLEGSGHPYNSSGTVQGEMFNYRRGKVTSAFSDPSMKGHVPTLLGLVGDYSKRLTGGFELPMPDSSLSKYSSPMVQKVRSKLQAAGSDLPRNPDNPSSRRTNTIGMGGRVATDDMINDEINRGKTRELSSDEVGVGRKTIRDILRPPSAAAAPTAQGPTEGFRGRPQEGREHQGALFTSRQLAATQRKAGFEAPTKARAAKTQAGALHPAMEGISYEYERRGTDTMGRGVHQVIARHPEKGVVGRTTLTEYSHNEQGGWGKAERSHFVHPDMKRTPVLGAMRNVAAHELGYRPGHEEDSYKQTFSGETSSDPGTRTTQIDAHLGRLLTPYTSNKRPSRRKQPEQLSLGI